MPKFLISFDPPPTFLYKTIIIIQIFFIHLIYKDFSSIKTNWISLLNSHFTDTIQSETILYDLNLEKGMIPIIP